MDDAAAAPEPLLRVAAGREGTFGLVIGIGLWSIGVPSPALWGVLAGLLRFVPYIGPMLAAVAPIGARRRDRSRLVDAPSRSRCCS